MERAIAVLVFGSLAFGLAGCIDISARLQSELEERAERGLASALDYALPGVQEMLRVHGSVDEITSDELLKAFTNDFTGLDMTDRTGIVFKDTIYRAVYELDEIDGTVRFHAFVGTPEGGAAGPITASLHRYTCGTISGSFGSTVLTIHDEKCPPALQIWTESPLNEISMEGITRDFELDAELPE